MNVNESQSGLTFVTLTLVRTGSFGTATVTWAVQPQTALLMDVGQSSGIVVIPNGVDTASFQIPIVADDVPEVDELLLVTLLTVAERNQRISPSQVGPQGSVESIGVISRVHRVCVYIEYL